MEEERIFRVQARLRVPPPGLPQTVRDYDWRSGLICVVASGLVELETSDGSQYKWPLESYERYRRPKRPELLINVPDGHNTEKAEPKPTLHVQFSCQLDLIRLDTDLRDEQFTRLYSEVLTETNGDANALATLPPKSLGRNLYLTFESSTERDAFLEMLNALRLQWLERLQAEQDARDIKTKRRAVEAYQKLVDRVVTAKEDEQKAAVLNQAGQLSAARTNALECMPELRLLYDDFVLKRNILSEEEFWRRHSEALAGAVPLPQPAEEFYFPSGSSASLARTATERVSALLIESKLVQRRFRELVQGGRLTEEEFWSRLFNSKFYAALIGVSTVGKQTESYFDEAECEENFAATQLAETMDPRTALGAVIPAHLHFANDDGGVKEGFGLKIVDDMMFATAIPDPVAEKKAGKKHPLTLFERFNRHANRALRTRTDSSVFYTVEQPQVTSVEDTIKESALGMLPSAESLGLLAALVTLENTLEGRKDIDRVNLMECLHERKAKELADSIIRDDLQDNTNTSGETSGPGAPESDAKRLIAMPCDPFDPADFAAKVAEEVAQYSTDINPMANELTATVAFVKFTTALKGSSEIENDKLLHEATHSPQLVKLFDSVADLQNKTKEIIFHVYNPPPGGRSREATARLRGAFEGLRHELTGLKKLEVDATGNRKLAGIINTRTLTQPLMNAMEAALARPEMRIV